MFGVVYQGHYAAAKGGVFGLKNVIAIEGAQYGILANQVLPHAKTRMITEAFAQHPAMLEMPLFKIMRPEVITPMVVYLASRECKVSHHNYSAGAGRYARVFAGVGPGWFAGDNAVTADDIAAHFGEVSATEPHYIPSSVADESTELCRRHGITFEVPGHLK
jgi:hypothetical protein